MADPLSADDLLYFYSASERLRAELRASLVEPASLYVQQLMATVEAERAWAQDPDRDDLADVAKKARAKLDTIRADFDKAVSAAKAVRTRRLSEEMAAATKLKP